MVGLGNPGAQYQTTRHNVGFMVVNRLGNRWRRGYRGHWTTILLCGQSRILLRPKTFMNRSGVSVAGCVHVHALTPDEVLVICDDLDLPLGRIRLKCGGGTGGHRGLASVREYLGTNEFPRLRIGIGRPVEAIQPREYVLMPFSPEEREQAGRVVALAADATRAAVCAGVEAAMNDFNGQVIPPTA